MLRKMLMATLVAGITAALVVLGTAPAAAQGSATRSFSPDTVSPGGRVTVTINAANYGSGGEVTESLPQGFGYVSSSLGSERVDVDPREVRFTLQAETSFTYTVTAASETGAHTFSGILRDSDGNDHVVGGAATVTVSSVDPLVARYDDPTNGGNGNGRIDRSEVIKGINDYLSGTVANAPSRADVIRLINLYLSGPAGVRSPGAPTDLRATANGQTRIDLSWSAPANNGGATITGYRIEVSTDGSSWVNLVANTNSTVTRHSHTGLTAGNTRHYRVSAINSAGTGPASSTATATTDSASGGASPDLVVQSPTVSDNSPGTGASFTLSATVRNQGSGSSGSTTLRYYRSSDSTISTGDTQVGTDAVGVLAASGTSSESLDLTAPATAGTYHYGACVDAVSGESNTGNNCSDAVQVRVEERPDLIVGPASVSNSSPGAGASFTLRATVRNQGSGSSGSTTLRYYRSSDSTISTSDTQIGTDPVGGLAASGTSSESLDLTAPATAGTYHYGVCVDAVSGESNTGNNCSDAVQVRVEERPDLVVRPVLVSNSSPDALASFKLTATVRNQGSGASARTRLVYYRSSDSTITTSDTQIGTDPVGGLAADAARSESIDLTAPATAGTYHYGACVEPVSRESNTGNNCSDAERVTVVERPDLVVRDVEVSVNNPGAGAPFTLSATVHNRGTVASGATRLVYYLSDDDVISTSDTQVGNTRVEDLAASGNDPRKIQLYALPDSGRYYYGACVEPVPGESNTTNNCSDAMRVTVS